MTQIWNMDMSAHNYSGSVSVGLEAVFGGSDTAGEYAITFNAEPDYSKKALLKLNHEPMFPQLDEADRRHKDAHKGLWAFKLVTPHYYLTDHSPISEFSMKADTVTYLDSFNGMFQKGKPDSAAKLLSQIRVLGLVEQDILAGPHKPVGAPRNNNLIASGKKTIPNTGPFMIREGQTVMVIPPYIDQVGNFKQSPGVQRIPDFETNLAPLITVPYEPFRHKGSPTMILAGIQHSRSVNGNSNNNASGSTGHPLIDKTLAVAATHVSDSLRGVFLVMLHAFVEIVKNRNTSEINGNTPIGELFTNHKDDLCRILGFQAGGDGFATSFKELFENELFSPSEKPMDANAHQSPQTDESSYSFAETPEERETLKVFHPPPGGSATVDLNKIQRNSISSLFRAFGSVEHMYDGLKIGLAMSNASPGREFDLLIKMVPGGSL